MRVVSLVPSLTETLIEAGVSVVGRTRYCVHPDAGVRTVPVVGGTKDLNWEKLRALQADLLLLDREENLPWMQEQSPIPVHVFHAESVAGMSAEMKALAALFKGRPQEMFLEQAARWEKIARAPARSWDWHRIPGERKRQGPERAWTQLLYLIWRDPWMSVSRQTFIASVFERWGATPYWPEFQEKYPKLDLQKFDPEKTLLLMSSEPYPFEKKWSDFEHLPHSRVLVDGEIFSWFGIRSLRALESSF
jgi:hypothetical protein